jgi:carbon storage regulator
MLILSRKVDEQIVIGEAVTIRVLGMKGGEVRLGIEAPDSVKILRGELVDRSARDSDRSERDNSRSPTRDRPPTARTL